MRKTFRIIVFMLLAGMLVLSIRARKIQKTLKDFSKNTLTWDGLEREYYLHLPPADKLKGKVPLVFGLHGGGGMAKNMPSLVFNRFSELSRRDGFILVYPQGIGRAWNDGRKVGISRAIREDIDDVGFIARIVELLSKKYPVDPERVFTCGMSNGGFMSTRLLCDRADIFRGGAILTAQISEAYAPKCSPSLPVAVMVMNGTDDPLVPYEGGDVKLFKKGKSRGKIISTDAFVEFWKGENGCQTALPAKTLPDLEADGTRVVVRKYKDCRDRGALELYRIEGGGHTWPGGKQYLGEKVIGKTCRDIVACDVIWEFFRDL